MGDSDRRFTQPKIMKRISLTIEKREQKGTQKVTGTNACGRLRKAGIIPAIIYGPSGSTNVQIQKSDFRKMMLEKGERAALIELHCGSDVRLSLVQASQRNPRNDAYLHVDFKEVDPKRMMVAKVPLKFVGESVGVKDEGGVLEIARRDIKITCLPEHLPEWIEVNIADLHLEQSIHVKDLPKLSGITYKTGPNEVLVACVNVEEEAEETSAETAAAAEGAVAATAEAAATSEATAASETKSESKVEEKKGK